MEDRENVENSQKGKKKHFAYRETKMRIVLDFSSETTQEDNGMKYLKYGNPLPHLHSILHSAKVSFKSEGKRKILSDK